MRKVIYQRCNGCSSHYYLSANNKLNIFLYKCANCGAQLTFSNSEPNFVLTTEQHIEIFHKYFMTMDIFELKYKLFHEADSLKRKQENKIKALEYRKNKGKLNFLRSTLHSRRLAYLNELNLNQVQLDHLTNKLSEIKLSLDLRLSEKQKALRILNLLFKKDYLLAKQHWENELSHIIDLSTFMKEAQNFVLTWFREMNLDLPDFEQALSIADVWNNMLITARAGSGKTRTLVNKSIFLISHCKVAPHEIMLLAFNKKAAEELNHRLEKILKDRSPFALTFHALAYSIVNPTQELIYDNLENLNKSKEVQSVIDSFIRNKDYFPQIKELMIKYFKDEWNHILETRHNLTPTQLLEFRRSSSSIGLDGKQYKSLGEKIIADYLFEHNIPFNYEYNFIWDERNYKPDFRIIYPKFSNKKSLIVEYFGITNDIEYNKQTKEKIRFWERNKQYDFLALYPEDVLYSEAFKQSIASQIENSLGCPRKLSEEQIWLKIKDRAIDEFSRLCASFINRCKQDLKFPPNIMFLYRELLPRLTEVEKLFLPIIIDIYSSYQHHLKMNNLEDFEGLLIRAKSKIEKGKTNWARKNSKGDLLHLKYIFIDEYQDFSLLFYKLIDSIKAQNNTILFNCVGDNWQAINNFAGSDLRYFNDFAKYNNQSEIYSILTNYRSSRSIVETSNLLMKNLGQKSHVSRDEINKVKLIFTDHYSPSDFERGMFPGDLITPILIKTINSFIIQDKGVAILSRRKNSIPYYISKNLGSSNFQIEYLKELKKFLPIEKHHLVKTFTTVHGFKGNEEDVVILVDVVDKSFPLLHPNNVFFEILGSTVPKILEEERRLLYVGLTRARDQLVIITDSNSMSPYLDDIKSSIHLAYLNPTHLSFPKLRKSIFTICISNTNKNFSTMEIRSELKGCGYEYDSLKKHWFKQVIEDNYNISILKNEVWFSYAKNILIQVKNEEDVLLEYIYL